MTILYENVRDIIQTGDLLQWRSATALGWLIRKFSKAKDNHTGGAVLFKEYQGKERRRFTLEALEHGYVLNLLSRRLGSHKGECYWHALKPEFRIFRVPIGIEMLKFCGVPYDYGSLFRQVFGHVSANARNLFCSEAIYLACRDAGCPIPDEWITTAPQPGDMTALRLWDEIGVKIK